ncbi:MAG: gliding motility-associated C-terminal domain-containing protein [Flavobacteriales bacterium]
MSVDGWVENKLDLTDSEITLNNNRLHLYNTHPDSLLWNTGFISGDSIGGYFMRSTDRTQEYVYPVGSNNLLNIYRAVSFLPSSADSSVIGVRLAAVDADLDFTGTSVTGSIGPFPNTQKAPTVLQLNPDFYHHIAKFHGNTNGQANIYYFATDELPLHDYNDIAFWNNSIPRWSIGNGVTFTTAALPAIGLPDRGMTISNLDFSNDVYALTIEDQTEAYVPQIFSPNGDGLNDLLFAYGNRFETLKFFIYNRWGEKVFETTDNSVGWDGTFRGRDAQAGVYVYYLEATILEGEKITLKGDITLVR